MVEEGANKKAKESDPASRADGSGGEYRRGLITLFIFYPDFQPVAHTMHRHDAQ